MGSSPFKTVIIPAIISLILFSVVTFVIVPVWRRYRNRYAQYLPLDAISNQTASLRSRITSRLASLVLPSTWRRDQEVIAATGDDDELDDGEELSAVQADRLRDLERRMGESRLPDHTRRLSRDLEEGFMDDSDDDDDGDMRGRR
ncbi:hypothetical protein VHEMI05692 [[Torrubiella] hemipterigena]|uniref:Uncharacterized protein n=1 Tax=[Torrubiella] hemipterigena TaxID=1531966 RepID=A0A0A1SYL4_9HYPO|nr:hypothetical protein VHEMI05692 [[Torrubiella] hemipterigena]